MGKNYYDILGVSRSASQDDIKKAYREMCKKYHPDRNGGDNSKIKEINEAYEVLGNPDKKRNYDSKSSSAYSDNDGFSGFNLNFQNMASDARLTVSISLEEAYNGCKYTTTINGKLYTIDIPKGVTNGKVLKIAGLGKSGYDIYGNKKTGDLIVTVLVQNTDKFNLSSMVNGTTVLEMMYGIDWIDAILGTEITVNVFDREVKVRVPKFTQNGGYTIVGNQGFHKFNSDELGPLRINFIIRMPKKLTDEQLGELRKIKESL